MSAILASLRVRFVLLAVLAVLPALGLLFYTVEEQRDLAVVEAQENAQRLASLAASDQGRQIESTRQLLIILARLPEVRDDPAACSALLADLLADYPLYANLGAIRPDGTLYCSGLPVTEPTDLSDRSYFQRALETREFAVGEFQEGRVTDEPTLNCAYPIYDEADQLIAVVYAAIDLDWLNQFAAQAPIDEGAVMTVFDRTGTVLVRYPDPDAWVGLPLSGTPVVQTILSQGRGVTEAPNDEGDPSLYAFAPLGGGAAPSAYLSIAIPRGNAIADANRAFDDNLAWLGIVTVLALVAAWVGGDLLVRRDTEANKALVRHLYDAFHTGGVDLLDEAVDPAFVDHDPMPGQAMGLVGLKQAVGLFRAAFPDGRLIADELVAEGDKVVAWVTLQGTQAGDFFGVSPSGDLMTADGMETYLIRDGKIVEGWSLFGPLRPVGGGGRREAEGGEDES